MRKKSNLYKFLRSMAMSVIVVFTALSCERDTFWEGTRVGRVGTGKPINVLLKFEVPQSDVEAVTRSITEQQEHAVNDIYIMIFADDPENNYPKTFSKYYPVDEMAKQEFSNDQGEAWMSIEQDVNRANYNGSDRAATDEDVKVNSTNGTLKVQAIDGGCYIFAFANVGSSYAATNELLEAVGVVKNHKQGTMSLRSALDNVKFKDDLYDLQVHLMSDVINQSLSESAPKMDILQRDEPNLLFSGAWSTWQKTDGYIKPSLANEGYVDMASYVNDPSAYTEGELDISGKGMIYLRALISQVEFKITWDEDIIEDFKPESWQVVHVPTRSYLMDKGDNVKMFDEIEFTASEENTSMIHEGATYKFNFYLYENHKNARKVGNGTSDDTKSFWYSLNSQVAGSQGLSGDAQRYLSSLGDATIIANYFKDYFGTTLKETTENGTLNKLHTVFGYLDRPNPADYDIGSGGTNYNNDMTTYNSAVSASRPQEATYTNLSVDAAWSKLTAYLTELGMSIPQLDWYSHANDINKKIYMFNTAVRAYEAYAGYRRPLITDEVDPNYTYTVIDPETQVEETRYITYYNQLTAADADVAYKNDVAVYNNGLKKFHPDQDDYLKSNSDGNEGAGYRYSNPSNAYEKAYNAWYDAEHVTDATTGLTANQKAIRDFKYAKREYEIKNNATVNSNNLALHNQKGDYNYMALYGYNGSSFSQTTPSFVPGVSGSGWEGTEPGDETYDAGYTGKWLKNQYESKKFVYVEPKATYVVIKGRLRFKHQIKEYQGQNRKGIFLTNYGAGYDKRIGVLEKEEDLYRDGYADVTYTIHLGYVGDVDKNVDPAEDFMVRRNTKYTYNVKINGVNSIYTNVEGNVDTKIDPVGWDYRVRTQPGADGMLSLAKGNVYNADAHYNQFNFMLTKAGLENFYFEIHTPWTDIRADQVSDVLELMKTNLKAANPGWNDLTPTALNEQYLNTLYNPESEYYFKKQQGYKDFAQNPDFTWFMFRPAWDQSGMFDTDAQFTEAHELVLRRNRPTVKYRGDVHENDCPLWNLFDFMVEMDKLIMDVVPVEGESAEEAKTRRLRQKFKCIVHKHGAPDETYDFSEGIPYLLLPGDMPPDGSGIENGITRMFYTVYLNEYYYETPPTGQSWDDGLPYWTKFVNKPSRYISFGYRDADAETTISGYKYSPDRQSGVMSTQFTIVQPSIQTYYNTNVSTSEITTLLGAGNTAELYVAMGLEHENETLDPRWTDFAQDMPEGSSNYNRQYGWENAKTHIVDKNITWSTYVSEYVYSEPAGRQPDDYKEETGLYELNGLQNNVTMIRSSTNNAVTEASRMKGGKENNKYNNTDNPYLAGAIRMCMNRNRDEDGNGKIDEYEMKWYLPTSAQINVANMCHFSLSDPLFNYNDYYVTGEEDSQRLIPSFYNGNKTFKCQYYYMYHFAGSDYATLTSEEMMNTPNYDNDGDWASRPHQMRCVRNLGGAKRNYSINGTIHNPDGSVVSQGGNLSVDYPGSHPVPVYSFDEAPENRTFTMKFLDSRSIREVFYRGVELPIPHYAFSKTNLPYHKFKVAQNYNTTKVLASGGTIVLDNAVPAVSGGKQHVFSMALCTNYYEDGDERDKGSWRIPNLAELALMEMWLRDKRNTSGQLNEYSPPYFFYEKNDNSWQPFCCTSWNYAGAWGRVFGLKYTGNDGWGVYLSDPSTWNYQNSSTPYNPSVRNGVTGIFFRCVKDVE